MMGRLRAGFASLALALGILAGCPAPSAAEMPSGTIYVTTLPAAADIWVDGTYVGRSPVLVDALVPGHHSVTITKTGWILRRLDVAVAAGDVEMSSTRLIAEARARTGDAVGTVVLRDIPSGAVLALDGATLDPNASGPLTLPAGRHRITATVGHDIYSHTITVLPDTATDVVMREPKASDVRSVVVAPAEDYLPTDNFSLEGKKIVVRYAGHFVVGYLGEQQVRVDGAMISYDGAPQSIDGKLYLPLALLEKLTDDTSDER